MGGAGGGCKTLVLSPVEILQFSNRTLLGRTRKNIHKSVYAEGEELANRITVGAGALMSVAGLVALVRVTALHGDPRRIASCTVYGSWFSFIPPSEQGE
jgi:predicted membrane channel-forming protein YqfA (hemolysin III family)